MVQFIMKDRVNAYETQDATLDKKGREEAEEFEKLKAKERSRDADVLEERGREDADNEALKVKERRRFLPAL